jgi:hypothetical protein
VRVAARMIWLSCSRMPVNTCRLMVARILRGLLPRTL